MKRRVILTLVAVVILLLLAGLLLLPGPTKEMLRATKSTLGHFGPHVIGTILGAAFLAVFSVLARDLVARWSKKQTQRGEERRVMEYLERLIRSSSTLIFGDPTRRTMDASQVAGILTLDQVWTPLRVTGQWATGDPRYRQAPSNRLPETSDEEYVTEVIAHIEKRRLVLLGDPGTGKSSTVSYIATVYAKQARESILSQGTDHVTLPIRAYLDRIKVSAGGAKSSDLWSGVPELDQLGGGQDLIRVLEDALRSGRALLLLDGLDEVDEALLEGVRGVVDCLNIAYPNSPVLVTCRAYDYFQQMPNRTVRADQVLRLLPYRFDPDMQLYVRNWYTAVVKAGTHPADVAEARRQNLVRSLEQNSELRELAKTPLLLTLLTLVHTEEGELPDSRALAYHRAIRYMLAETAQWRRQAAGATVASTEMMSLAERVAYVAHRRMEGDTASAGGLTRSELHNIVAEFFRLSEVPPGPRYEEASSRVSAHLARLVQSNGLMADHGGGRFSFAHKSFREFLAGQYFSSGSRHAEALRAAQQVHWRETFRLLAGYGAREGKSLHYLLDLIDDLVKTNRSASFPSPSPRDAILAGEMLTEIGRDALLAGGHTGVLEAGSGLSGRDGLWTRVAETVTKRLENPIALETVDRIRAGNVLGGLGDPRFRDAAGQRIPAIQQLVELPGLEYTIGSAVGVGREDERPRRTFDFPTFCIGKYMVTNDEFAGFIEDEGYDDTRWWETEDAKAWIRGDEEFLKVVEGMWVRTVTEYHAKELRDKLITGNLAEEARKRCRPRRRPFYCGDHRYDRRNQPVVGVNWWEARAYCTWLTAKGYREGWLETDQVFRLPTEFEWERVARGVSDDRMYPWGDVWEHSKAHTREDTLELLEAVAVGCYPLGTWSGGPLDMSGNVWEWLENKKYAYDDIHDAARIGLDGLEDRAIRGSSWYNVPEFARCASRFVDRPYNVYFDLGFRVVRVLKSLPLMPPERPGRSRS